MGSFNQNLFKDVELQIQRLDNGMTFHQLTCESCTDQGACNIWVNMVRQWTFLNLAEEIYDSAQNKDTT